MEVIGVVVFLLVYLSFSALLFARYILFSLSLMGLANRLDVKNAWLAWIPVGNAYVLGSAADRLEEKRDVSHKWGKLLLILNLAVVALFFVVFMGLIAFAVYMGIMESTGAFYSETFYEEGFFVLPIIFIYLIYFVVIFAAMALNYLTIICVYKIFEEIAPQKSIKYILLYMLVPFGDVFCLFKCKKLIPDPAVPTAPSAGDPAFGYDVSATQQENFMNSRENHHDQENQQ